ncbi:glycoside hydrolase family 43 protein [Pseudocolwellia agarivorans]|uniref:glycoside hydrolase family 43 protein n=1 Tax=Pseudocolwellia agarivorans TaxID=1911682 RepID=UPI000985BCE7|nr:glycoside hydrolase family 43 protein [Pseudocolwellia agarivorans]
MTSLAQEKQQTSEALSHAEQIQQKDLERANLLKNKSDPLVKHIYTADPSAHVFDGKIYVYPSHDVESENSINDDGDHFAMNDYHVLSLDKDDFSATDHGVALHVDDVPWASKQMWAPDAAHKEGTYYFYFPARDKDGIFRIGVASSSSPTGPFKAEPDYIQGTFSIDPAVYEDDDGSYYLYFGGLWGGQLQNWYDGKFNEEDKYPADNEAAIPAKMAKLSANMLELAEEPKDIVIIDENGDSITVGDNNRRFFEGPWVHKYNGVYYFSYSTGDTHKIAYATSSSPYGPFTYQGVILNPVLGWTNHHSITCYEGKWYLFYHDSSLSGGQTHLRCVKMTELIHDENGKIETVDAYEQD